MEAATAVLQNAFDVCDQFKQNMALKNGLERPEKIRLDSQNVPSPQQTVPQPQLQPQVVVTAVPQPATSPSRQESSLWPWLATTAAIALGSGGIGAATAVLSRPETPQPIVVQHEPQQPGGDDGLLADLQERGFHLPPAKVQP